VAFDPNAAAGPESGIFGLPHTEQDAGVVIVPVPFEATTSYGAGTADGPAAVLEASRQVDLFDRETGRPYEAGIAMLPIEPLIVRLNAEAKAAAERSRQAQAAGDLATAADLRREVDRHCARVNDWLHGVVREQLDRGKIVGTLGGDHGCVFGAIAAHAERYPGLGLLHVDAHSDLRDAYEGFEWSHASIIDNVAKRLINVTRIVQVGVRDFCEDEVDAIEASQNRIHVAFDADLAHERLAGVSFKTQVERLVALLPRHVYVSFDIDGLDPKLCPATGTPVPGGLQFHEATFLIGEVVRSGRSLVGFDLAEVAPSKDGSEWDANVGARMLYKLIGHAVRSRGATR
jgi:agmatinase